MSYVAAVLADAPVHYWRIADPGGLLLHDIGSSQRALNASTAFILPYSGPAADGGSGYFDANTLAWNLSGVSHSSPFSLECWVWLHNLGSTNQQLVFGHLAALVMTATGHAGFYDGTLQPLDPGVLSVNAWHHLVGTYGPTGGSKLYVDGFNVVTAGYSGVVAPSTVGVSIGGQVPGATQYAQANIAECAIFNTELPASHVTNHFVAADAIATKPIYRAGGTFSGTTGGTVTISDLSNAILASVRKTY